MELHTKTLDGGIELIAPEGEMDLYNSGEFKTLTTKTMDSGPAGIVVDLDQLEYIDSSGISALLFTFTQCKSKGIGLCFVNIKGSVRKVIELTSLSGFFPIADNLDAALERLQANK
jgi:anti-sigma B factor antagonist